MMKIFKKIKKVKKIQKKSKKNIFTKKFQNFFFPKNIAENYFGPKTFIRGPKMWKF